MPESYGANISTRAGEGEAGIFNWEPLHRQVNQMIQRDLYHQRVSQQAADRAALELQAAGKGARAADIPELTEHFNNFKTAGIKLLDPKVQEDPTQRAYWTKIQNDSQLNYHALLNEGKKLETLYPQLQLEYHKANGSGFLPIDEFSARLEKAKSQSTSQNKKEGLDSLMAFTGPHEILNTKEYDNYVPGLMKKEKVIEDHKNSNGQIDYQTEKEITKPKVPLNEMFNTITGAIASSPNGIGKMVNDRYHQAVVNGQEPVIQQTIQAAQDYLKTKSKEEQEHISPYLANNPLGYELSQKLLASKESETYLGRKSDPIYEHGQTRLEQQRDNARQERFHSESIGIQRANLKLSQQAAADKHNKIIGTTQGGIDTDEVYNAMHNPQQRFDVGNGQTKSGEEIVDAAVNAVASNNKSGIKPVVITKDRITDPKERDRLAQKLGIDVASAFPGKLTPDQVKEKMVDDFISKYNATYLGQKINKNTINSKAIVSVVSSKNQSIPTGDPKNPYTYQTIKSAKVIDPSVLSPEEFQRELSQMSAGKKKDQKANEGKVYSENKGREAKPQEQKQQQAGVSKWSKYKR